MDNIVVYIHGKGGTPAEAAHYAALFENCDVIGFDYHAQSPWKAKEEFPVFFAEVCRKYQSVTVIANSIGAYFAMNALSDFPIDRAYFISPIVNMEKLITDMMLWANVTEEELYEKKVIQTAFGETLSWEYLCYVREHPVAWKIQTHVLYGEKDHLTSLETISEFTSQAKATLTIMASGEHWFHTEEQMQFLDNWIQRFI